MSVLANLFRRRAPDAIISPDMHLARIKIEAVCHDCKHRHRYDEMPDRFPTAMSEWERKHRGHNFEFLSPSRMLPRGFDDRAFERAGKAPWWVDYRHNADLKLAYAGDAAFTITLASLATSSTFVAGREATAISNAGNKYLDYDIAGQVTTGTSPTASTEIRLYGIKPINDTPTWAGGFDGSDSAGAPTNVNVLNSLPLLWATNVATSSNVVYPIINALTIAQVWGVVPDLFSVYLAHSTAVNLNSTGSNHEINYRGIYATSS